uniref:Hexosyltransferase n=1 Tax=Octactis speculum TaxID=3111310 RepID=A0A7S2FZ30_9STRA
MFNSGGSGYVLNQAALDILADNIVKNPQCQPHLRGFFEDVMVARCLKRIAGLVPYDTRDARGRERFLPFTPASHLAYRRNSNDWYTKYSVDLKEGLDCCSEYSISFHYVKGSLMNGIDTLLYRC